MSTHKNYDVIIIGGSYAGLSAAMSLGRALRSVLVIDSGQPCNEQTPHSHNFITQDGQTPSQIATLAKEQVAKYDTVEFYSGLASRGTKTDQGFSIHTEAGDSFTAKKLLFAAGLKDIMPNIPGFAACWGISILHCPYCHGYEVKNQKTALLGNGDIGFHLVQLISNWTKDLVLFTNGESTLSPEQTKKIAEHNIPVIQTELDYIEHQQGKIQNIVLKDQSKIAVQAMYARPANEQHCQIPLALGCALTQQGLLQVDMFQKTSIAGVYACGDNSSMARAVAAAVSTGMFAGASINRELIEEEF